MEAKEYRIVLNYNNGGSLSEVVSATNATNALKKAKAHNFLKNVMYQTGSAGTACAYRIHDDGTESSIPEVSLHCQYSPSGKWHARYW